MRDFAQALRSPRGFLDQSPSAGCAYFRQVRPTISSESTMRHKTSSGSSRSLNLSGWCLSLAFWFEVCSMSKTGSGGIRSDVLDLFDLRNGSRPLVLLRAKSLLFVSSTVASFDVDADVLHCFNGGNSAKPLVTLTSDSISLITLAVEYIGADFDLRLGAISGTVFLIS